MARLTVALVAAAAAVAHGALLAGTVNKVGGQWAFHSGVADSRGVAYGTFDDALASTGWGVLRIETNGSFADNDQMYAAGMLEGALTATRIYENLENLWPEFFNTPNFTMPHEYATWFDAQSAWARSMASSNSSAFWKQVGFVLAQFDGLPPGTMRAAAGSGRCRRTRWTSTATATCSTCGRLSTRARAQTTTA